MLWLRGCRRCGGDLYDSQDIYGYYVSCMQCGYYLTEVQLVTLLTTERGEAEEALFEALEVVA